MFRLYEIQMTCDACTRFYMMNKMLNESKGFVNVGCARCKRYSAKLQLGLDNVHTVARSDDSKLRVIFTRL